MTTEDSLLTMIREVRALGRAELDRPRTALGDHNAQRALTAGLQALDQDGYPSDISLSVPLLAPRAPYFDRLVLDAITTGVPQVVNLGAAYDDRTLRFRNPATTYFELDLTQVITDKTQRLATMGADLTGIHLVGVDFARDDVATVLAEHGHDADQPTLFLAEHLNLFLQPTDVTRLISAIGSRAAAGSRFALTAETHPDDLDSVQVIHTADAVMFGGAGPVHTIWSLPRWTAVLDETGWRIDDADHVVDHVVDHFSIPINDHTVQIRTRFLTARINDSPPAHPSAT